MAAPLRIQDPDRTLDPWIAPVPRTQAGSWTVMNVPLLSCGVCIPHAHTTVVHKDCILRTRYTLLEKVLTASVAAVASSWSA